MAVTRQVNPDVVRCTQNADTTAMSIILRGYSFSHTAAGSVRITSSRTATTSATAFVIDRVTTTILQKTVFFPEPIPLKNGFKVFMTGTLLLYV